MAINTQAAACNRGQLYWRHCAGAVEAVMSGKELVSPNELNDLMFVERMVEREMGAA